MRAIRKFGQAVEEHRYAACIFPEGTRARDGEIKEFNAAGLLALMRATPSATIVPVAIDGSWELMRFSMRPIPFGVRVRCTVLAPIGQNEHSARSITLVVEDRIREAVTDGRRSALI